MNINSDNQVSLWLELTQHRYFLIPDNQELLNGNCCIRKMMGLEKQVDPEAIAP